MRLVTLILFVAGTLLWISVAASQNAGNKSKELDTPPPRLAAVQFVQGTYQGVDLKAGTLKLKTRRAMMELSLNSKDVPITGDISRKTELRELESGTQVLLKLSAQNDIVGIHCIGPQVRGKLAAIDAARRIVTMSGHDALPIPPYAQIAVGGRYPLLEDVPIGGIAFVRLTIDRKQVQRLHVVSTPKSGRTGPLDDTRVAQGVLEHIDLAKGTIKARVIADIQQQPKQIPLLASNLAGLLGTLSNDGPLPSVTALAPRLEARTFPSNMWVQTSLLDGRPNGLADLMAGMRVKLWLAADKDEVIFVRAEPTLRGVLKEIDVIERTITLAAPKGQPAPVYHLEKNAHMMIHGWDSELQDFQPGWTVSLVLTKEHRVRALWTLVNLLER